jgi:hypothetical protein
MEVKEVGAKREEDQYIRRPSYWNAVKWMMDDRKVQDIDRLKSDIQPRQAKEKTSRWQWGREVLRKCLEKLTFRAKKPAENMNPQNKITLEWKRLILRRILDKAKEGLNQTCPLPISKGKERPLRRLQNMVIDHSAHPNILIRQRPHHVSFPDADRRGDITAPPTIILARRH